MPRSRTEDGRCRYTLRFHPVPSAATFDPGHMVEETAAQVEAMLAPALAVPYDPANPGPFAPTHSLQNGLDLGRPDVDEVEQLRRLQQRLWAVPDDYLYPADIHAQDFGIGTSLVARDAATGKVVGGLIGFYKWAADPLPDLWTDRLQSSFRIESQSLAVEPSYRGKGIGFRLKRVQADQAQKAGIDLVEWTTDPLLFTNAALNFGKLRAVSTQFYPDLIPFRNVLNQLPASRLRMTLLVPSARVQDALTHPGAMPSVRKIATDQLPVRVNDGWSNPRFGVEAFSIAIEIPKDWAALQRMDLEAATRWRATTDRLLSHYIGTQPGQYILTTPAKDGDRCFLIGERVEGDLLAQIGAMGQ